MKHYYYNKRIRYTSVDKRGIKYSIRIFYSKKWNTSYRVKIDTKLNNFEIINQTTKRAVVKVTHINNYNVMMRNIGKKLKDLGVEFNQEYRNRTYGRNKPSSSSRK